MREQQLVLPVGSLSMRSFFSSIVAIIVASLVYILLCSPIAGAQTPPTAEWSGSSITYNQHQYIPLADAKAGDSHNLPAGSKLYAYVDPAVSSPSSPTKKAHLIYFAPGIDPLTATSANLVTYDFTAPTYSNPSGATTITITPKPPGNPGTTSCVIEGIGWIVCPVTKFLAKSMDGLFNILSSFLAVRPVVTDPNTALFRAWSFMRNFANIAFVMAFLVIIYSQLTGIGLTNYSLKKIFPRLIIAAILVNISYWICSVAIDASNIAGYSIQDIFIAMRNSLVGTEGNNWDVMNWESASGFLLSGGTAIAGGAIAWAAFGAVSIQGALYLLLPTLVGVLLAVLVALLVMAARQAIITILVILSPLAFVAFLLPNTEKYFEKWRGLGTTMLIMFPLFSIIFGGSQLAGTAIIQNADSFNLILLGMAVQVAPVVITPLLVKFSGSLLGRIAGMVNNPNKGLIDRTRKWSQERADQNKAHTLANPDKKRGYFARKTQNFDAKKRERAGLQKANETMADALWTNNKRTHAAHDIEGRAALIKEAGENAAHKRFEDLKSTDSLRQQLDINARASKVTLDTSKAVVEANWDEMKAGDARSIITPAGLAGNSLAAFIANRDAQVNAIRDNTLTNAIEARRGQSAQHIQQQQYAEAVDNSQLLQQRAGGIDPAGAQRAQAHALSEQYKARAATIDNANAIIEHSNLDGQSTLQLALGNAQGNITATDDIREAAIKKIASDGNIDAINKLVEGLDLSPVSNDNHRIALVETLKKNSARPKYIGFAKMDEIKQGVPGGLGSSGLDDMIEATINGGKLSAEVLVTQDQDALTRISDAINRNRASYSQAVLDNLKKEISKVYDSDLLKIRVGERDKPLKDILRQI